MTKKQTQKDALLKALARLDEFENESFSKLGNRLRADLLLGFLDDEGYQISGIKGRKSAPPFRSRNNDKGRR